MPEIDPTNPLDNAIVSQHPANERASRLAAENILAKDHVAGGDTADDGEHTKVTLQEQGADPTNAADKGFLYSKDVTGETELFYRDSTGAVIQLTVGGAINAQALDAFTAKLNVVQTWTKQQHYDLATLTDAASIAWNLDDEPIAKVTITASRLLANPTNLQPGTYVLKVIQGGAGGFALTYGSVFKWSNGVVPTLTTAAAAEDILTFVCDGVNMYGVESLNFS